MKMFKRKAQFQVKYQKKLNGYFVRSKTYAICPNLHHLAPTHRLGLRVGGKEGI